MEDLVTQFNGLLARSFQNGDYFDIDVVLAKNPKGFQIKFANDKLNKNPDAPIGLEVDINLKENSYSFQSKNGLGYGRFFDVKDKMNIRIMYSNDVISITTDEKNVSSGSLNLLDPQSYMYMKAIQIVGDIKLIERVDHRSSFPALWPPSNFTPAKDDRMFLSNDIPIKFQPGHLMVLTARCYGSSNGNFLINMKHANSEELIMEFKVDFGGSKVYRRHLKKMYNYHNSKYRYDKC
ncbi:uncharacterized protein [Musca autumnalis]|uniref:uncharacterized protein n=1 Tax=Musca autumnalis TaxID=221902 RepID=UPI003CF2A968